MEKTQQHKVRRLEVLFSRHLPFKFFGHQIMYVETVANEDINTFLLKNIMEVTDIFDKQFIYLPGLLEEMAQIVDYNWPGTDSARIEEARPDSSWYLDTYREILSYRIDKKGDGLELPFNISEMPLLMRYEYTTSAGHLFTLFPLQYSNDEQFEQLLKAIAHVPYSDSGIRSSTITETCYLEDPRDSKSEDPRDRADWHEISFLADEIKQRIEKLELMGVSDYVIRRLIDLPEPKLSKLLITKDYRIFLTDYNNMEIAMPTLSKVVFFFYLRHPEGLRFKELIDYKDELLYIYYRISNRGEVEKMEQSIDELVDSTRNSINEKCSRIRSAFVSRFCDDLAKNYYITYGEGRAKHIALDRVLVIDESGIITNKP